MRVSARLRWRMLALGVLLAPAIAGEALAQHPLLHGMARGPEPIQERVAEAEHAAVVKVEAISGGRILVTAEPVLGNVPSRFALKRRPSAPLPLARGDRALLLLRGARTPYLVVGEPADTIRIGHDAAAARWSEAIRSVAAARGDPATLRPLFLAWSESDDEGLRSEALRALRALGGPFLPLPPPLAEERARVALDTLRTLPVRRAAATLAVSADAGLDLLLDRIAARPDDTDAEVLAVAVATGLQRQRRGASRALVAALHAGEPELRIAALSLVRQAPRELVEQDLATLAARDPDPRVREQAAHWLARVQQGAPGGT